MPDHFVIDLDDIPIPNDVKSGFHLFYKINHGEIKTIFREDLEKILHAFTYYCMNHKPKPAVSLFLNDVAIKIADTLKEKKDMWLVEITEKEGCVCLS